MPVYDHDGDPSDVRQISLLCMPPAVFQPVRLCVTAVTVLAHDFLMVAFGPVVGGGRAVFQSIRLIQKYAVIAVTAV